MSSFNHRKEAFSNAFELLKIVLANPNSSVVKISAQEVNEYFAKLYDTQLKILEKALQSN